MIDKIGKSIKWYVMLQLVLFTTGMFFFYLIWKENKEVDNLLRQQIELRDSVNIRNIQILDSLKTIYSR